MEYSPAAMLPGIVLPIFGDEQNTKNYHFQIWNDDEKVIEFRRVANFGNRVIFYDGPRLVTWIGQRVVFGYALSDTVMFFSHGAIEFRERISRLETDGIFLRSPISGVEISRYLNQIEAECKYAEMAAAMIAATNQNVAQNWVEKGILSSDARARARVALAARYQPRDFEMADKTQSIIEQTPNFAKRYRVARSSDQDVMFVTGWDYRRAHNIGVFHIDALLMDLDDGRDVVGTFTEYGRLIASGKCAEVYILTESAGEKYLKERGVKVIPWRDYGTARLLVDLLFDKLKERRAQGEE